MTKKTPNLVDKILATKFGFVPDWSSPGGERQKILFPSLHAQNKSNFRFSEAKQNLKTLNCDISLVVFDCP